MSLKPGLFFQLKKMIFLTWIFCLFGFVFRPIYSDWISRTRIGIKTGLGVRSSLVCFLSFQMVKRWIHA